MLASLSKSRGGQASSLYARLRHPHFQTPAPEIIHQRGRAYTSKPWKWWTGSTATVFGSLLEPFRPPSRKRFYLMLDASATVANLNQSAPGKAGRVLMARIPRQMERPASTSITSSPRFSCNSASVPSPGIVGAFRPKRMAWD